MERGQSNLHTTERIVSVEGRKVSVEERDTHAGEGREHWKAGGAGILGTPARVTRVLKAHGLHCIALEHQHRVHVVHAQQVRLE